MPPTQKNPCNGCIYAWAASSGPVCLYILHTRHMRPCPAGEGCTVKEMEKKRMRQRTWDTERAKRLFDEGADDIAIADAVGATETAIKTWRARNHLKHPKTDEAPAVTEKRPGDERTSTPADPAVSGSVTEHRTMELPRKLRPTLVPVSLVPAVAMVMEYEALAERLFISALAPVFAGS